MGASIWTPDLDPDNTNPLRLDLGSTELASQGSGIVSHNPLLNYLKGSIGYLLNKVIYSSSLSSLQAAINLAAAYNAPLIIDQNYTLTAGITVPANLEVTCLPGVKLTWTSQVVAITLGAGVSWTGGEIIGPGGSVYGATGYGITAYGVNNNPAAPTYIKAPRINKTVIHGWNFAGIWLSYTYDGEATKNTVYDCGYVGIAGISCTDVSFDKNIVYSIKGSGAPDTYGIFFSATEQSEVAAPRSKACSISYNHVYDVPNWEAIDIHGDVDIYIVGNVIHDCRFGVMSVSGQSAGGAEDRGPKRIRIIGNSIIGKLAGVAGGQGAAITAIGGDLQKSTGIVILGNTIENGGVDNGTSEGAIRIYDMGDVIVANNTIRNAYTWSIALIQNIDSALIIGNNLINPRASTYTTPSCIWINSNNVKASIANNNFVYNDATVDTFVAVRSIFIQTAIIGLDIDIGQNFFKGIDATHLTALLGTTTGVISEGLMTQSGSGTLVAGTLNVSFPRRFPSTPKIFISENTSNAVVPSSITATGFTATGTGTDTFNWLARV